MRGKACFCVGEFRSRGITPAYAGKSQKPEHDRADTGDHPRVCGEKARTLIVQDEPQGSPPRMRGKESDEIVLLALVEDHPRVCGEKSGGAPSNWAHRGSPPRMRGKGSHFSNTGFCHGITPAYAGKSTRGNLSSSYIGDHPRVCGEKSISRPKSGPSTGSPPRMRGKVCVASELARHSGITPAYAGKRISSYATKKDRKDHPRVCGEKVNMIKYTRQPQGSPPRMRGKVVFGLVCHAAGGITPAYAGKRTVRGACPLWTRDHPRVCGEKTLTNRNTRVGAGSPPRMRGKGLECRLVPFRLGITPAYAGKRKNHGGVPDPRLDHPRVCGEKPCYCQPDDIAMGSPPRMRGKAHIPAGNRTSVGITPAYAGKSRFDGFRRLLQRDHPRVCGEKVTNDSAGFAQ